MREKFGFIERTKKEGNVLTVVLLAVVFGLGGGVAGAMVARSYFVDALFSTGEEVNVTQQDSLRRANLVIENAKKIVVEQDNKARETINSAQNSLVGIFKKKEAKATSSASVDNGIFDINDYYKLDEEAGEGIIITSDGWMLTADFAKNTPEDAIVENYVVITRAKEVYEIDRIIKTSIDSYTFIHLAAANNLPVKSFSTKESLSNSQMLVAVNWQGESYLTSLLKKEAEKPIVRFSDVLSGSFVLSDPLEDFFEDAFLFNLNGELVGFFNKKSGSLPLDGFQPFIKGLLEKKEYQRPSLGIAYINLSDYAIKNARYERGALVYSDGKKNVLPSDSAAAKAGLQAGDLILAVNNVEIDKDNDLADVINKFSAGEEINIIYLRGQEERAVKVRLAEGQ